MLVGALLSEKEREEMREFLRKNKNVFAWSHKYISRIDPNEAKHFLNRNPTFPLVR